MYESHITGFRQLDPEETSLNADQLSEILQQIESEIFGKLMDEIRKTEDTILKASNSLSENSLCNDIASMSSETAPEEEDVNPEQFQSRGPESEPKNTAPKSTISEARLEVQDIVTGISEADLLRKKKTHSSNQASGKDQHHSKTETQQLAQTIARLYC